MTKGDKWTKEEDLYLRKYVGKKSLLEIAAMLDRPYHGVKARAKMIGASPSFITMVDRERDEDYMRKVWNGLA